MLNQLGNMNMLMYIVIMAILITIAISVRVKNGIMVKLAFRFVVAIGIIYGINYITPHIGIDASIPLNPVTASIIALLQAPGMALIYIAKYAIYPM
ncbi:pro-sigmaK processing inhibitor BofA family protein [Clostridium cylindrosporum]|uniref:SigmaK-factor processing regulatory protein BofA n=1 Tax=Clostridium cylindrosporum DSM 605 TaxID=1121307 RepID=A0A0J8G432_CLOCY|nr:pro-sigmaK processing inhibitor BofA family protein [Clostridium cylindrosporum]KMT22456.1 sigmaK-factor processing regulatory protein BofA [Clostridium cylindrosporum DSM 605]